jgi:hypothetical protein
MSALLPPIYGGKPPNAVALLLAQRRKRPGSGCAAHKRDEVAAFQCPKPPVLPSERIAHLSYSRRLLRCGISITAKTVQGHPRRIDLPPKAAECPLFSR